MNKTGILLLILFVCFLSSNPKGLSIGIPSENPEECFLENRNDTIFKIVLEGEDCPFAHHAEYGVYIPEGSSPLQGVLILQHGCTKHLQRSGSWQFLKLHYTVIAIYGTSQNRGAEQPFLRFWSK